VRKGEPVSSVCVTKVGRVRASVSKHGPRACWRSQRIVLERTLENHRSQVWDATAGTV